MKTLCFQENLIREKVSVRSILKKIDRDFCEQDIIDFHALFLKNGLHTITTRNIKSCRLLMYTCLETLNCYQNIGCLTLSTLPLKESIYDITPSIDTKNLQEFFIEQCDFDFMWIELTPQLEHTSWFVQFKALLNEFTIIRHIPVVISQIQNRKEACNY
jgi:hypothetical protein